MIPEFGRLSNTETELLFKAPFMACILIAGADGDIDKKELKSAMGFGSKRLQNAPKSLIEFYREIGEDFEDKLKMVFQSYPAKAAKRNPQISEELAQLNAILPKLDKPFAIAFYKSIKAIAVEIANSSGGVLGFNKVGDEEARYMDLSMIKDPS